MNGTKVGMTGMLNMLQGILGRGSVSYGKWFCKRCSFGIGNGTSCSKYVSQAVLINGIFLLYVLNVFFDCLNIKKTAVILNIAVGALKTAGQFKRIEDMGRY